jgi:hypothetical protein
MVNSVLSSLPTFFMCSIKVPIEILNQIDKYRKHYLWRGGEIESKKPPLAAWDLVARPKMKGGLGVIHLRLQNNALLMKNLHKFFNKAYLPWVKLLWSKYYSNGKVPGTTKKGGGGWWRSVISLLTTFKGIAHATVGWRDSALFWIDMWNGRSLQHSFPHLYTYAVNTRIIVKVAAETELLQGLFQTPMSVEAFEEYCELEIIMQTLQLSEENDSWDLHLGQWSLLISQSLQTAHWLFSNSPCFQMDLEV